MDRLEALVVELKTFVEEREWSQFHDPKNLAMAIASEAGELLAEYRWISSADADRLGQVGSEMRSTPNPFQLADTRSLFVEGRATSWEVGASPEARAGTASLSGGPKNHSATAFRAGRRRCHPLRCTGRGHVSRSGEGWR